MLGPEFDGVIARAAAGDSASFAVLWRDCHPMLVRYLRTLAADDAEDIASETWIEVARVLERFHGDESGFRAWLVTIARRRLIDRQRYAARRPERLVDDVQAMDAPAPDDTAAAAAERVSTEAALRLVATLPPDQAEMVLLRVVVGLEPTQIAEIVGRSPGAVRVGVHRGLRALAERLAAEHVTQSDDSTISGSDV